MPRKKVDSRVRTLIENGVKTRTRSFIVLVGDRGKDQVANLHYILSKAQVKARPSVLWCYSKELGFSTCVLSSSDTRGAYRGRAARSPVFLSPQGNSSAQASPTLSPPPNPSAPAHTQPPPEAHEADQEAAGQGSVRL
jgi:hypothetical protein